MLDTERTWLLHLNHWCVIAVSGKPTQVPEETVSSLPVILVPVTTGLVVANGEPKINADEVNLSTDPSELEAVMREIRCFIASWLCIGVKVFALVVSETLDGLRLSEVVPFPSSPNWL